MLKLVHKEMSSPRKFQPPDFGNKMICLQCLGLTPLNPHSSPFVNETIYVCNDDGSMAVDTRLYTGRHVLRLSIPLDATTAMAMDRLKLRATPCRMLAFSF